MKTKNYEARATQDITIGELPKQDNPNNSDLLVIQGSSLTEATSIQQLRNKILGGSDASTTNLGEYIFTSSLVTNNSLHLMDGSLAYKNQFQEFYDWLLIQSDSVKSFYSLDIIAESFIFPLINNRNLKINTAISNYTGGIAQGLTNHTHRVEGEYQNGFWVNQQSTPPNLTNQKRVLVQIDTSYQAKTGIPKDSANNQSLTTGEQAYISTYMYVRVSTSSNVLASKSILSNGSVSMDLEYTPIDIQDVATKRYIDNKFLNYEVPLSFSINDIGKKIPYYSNAENNPTLIALDGTKYLISDYPDFDYATQEGFTNDGVYFWFANIELELKSFQNNIQPSSEWFKLPFYSGRVKGQTMGGNYVFNSKMIYNFLNSPQGARFLFANDALGENAKNNGGFTILNPVDYTIRANYNNYGGTRDVDVLPTAIITKYKQSYESIYVDGFGGAVIAYPFYSYIEGTGLTSLVKAHIGSIGEVSYLKIQPDYMVAKIQQVGGGASGSGDLKSDRSVLLTGTGLFNTKQIASMDDLKDSNIIVTDEARVITTLKDKLDGMDSIITNLTNKLNSYDTKYRSFTSKRVKTGLNVSINSNANNLTNLTQYFIASQNPTITSFGSSISGLPLGAINLIEVGTGVNQGFKFPVINGIVNTNLIFNIRVTGAISGNAGTPRELICYLRRISDNSLVANGGIIKVNDNNFNSRSVIVPSFLQGATDPFYTGGFYLNLLNNSGGNLTLTSIELLIQG
jgi:hypothetical protein